MASSSNLGLGVVLTADASKAVGGFKQLDQAIGKSSKTVSDMSKALGQMAVAGAVFAGGAGAMSGLYRAADAAGKFDYTMASVGAVMRASAVDMKKLEDAAISAGIATQFSPQQAATGLRELATAGQTATQATQTLIPALDLAAGSFGQLTIATSANAVVGTLNAYNMRASEAVGITDKLLRITQMTNFQARDFEGGLAKAAAAGATFNQSLDDVLVTMGLLRNRNIDASSASTAYRESTRRMASDSLAWAAAQKAGVDVFDKQTGAMRSMIDVSMDLSAATAGMTDQKRNAIIVDIYGARGLLAFSAIQKAAFTDSTGKVLEGRDAIAAMRKELGGAKGAAEEFRTKLLNTFEGQKILLKGTLETYQVVLGKSFATIFKPIVGWVLEKLNVVLEFVRALPEPVKKAASMIAMATAGFVTLTGALLLGAAAFKLVAAGAAFAGISITGMMATMLPVVAVLGVLGLTIAGVVVAGRKNVGGLGDSFADMGKKAKLALSGLAQAFTKGELSGSVLSELNKAGNLGVKQFVIDLYSFAMRLKNFVSGAWSGFVAGIEKAKPTFEALGKALAAVGKALGFEAAANVDANRKAWDAYGSAGAKTGGILAGIAELGAGALTTAFKTITEVIKTTDWKSLKNDFHGAASGLAEIGKALGAVSKLLRMVNVDTEKSTYWFGSLSGILGFLGTRLSGLGPFASGLNALFSVLRGTIAAVANTFMVAIEGMVRAMLPFMVSIGKGGTALGWIKSLRGARADMRSWSVADTVAGVQGGASGEGGYQVAVAPASAEEERLQAEGEAHYGAMPAPRREAPLPTKLEAWLENMGKPPTGDIVLKVDGEVFGRLARKSNRNDAIGGFSSDVPAEEGSY